MSRNNFSGPLFIVGMPRSGTKLLRDLLNRHPKIAIITNETNFLPYWYKHWDSYGDLYIYENFRHFYKKTLKIPFFVMRKRQGRMIDVERWFELCRSYDTAGVFEALARYDVGAQYGTDIIWGDKTPGYVTKTKTLKTIFPEAKFIHIIRDVRDYCLSINKAWNKNMIRATQRWADAIKCAREENLCSNNYIEIKYEDILDRVEPELRKVCEFLGVDFCSDMLTLSKPSEDIGDAKGSTTILQTNQGKFKKQLSSDLQTQIEAIAGPLLYALGYPVNNVANHCARVNRKKMFIYQVMDGLNILCSNIRRRGRSRIIKTIWSYIAGKS